MDIKTDQRKNEELLRPQDEEGRETEELPMPQQEGMVDGELPGAFVEDGRLDPEAERVEATDAGPGRDKGKGKAKELERQDYGSEGDLPMLGHHRERERERARDKDRRDRRDRRDRDDPRDRHYIKHSEDKYGWTSRSIPRDYADVCVSLHFFSSLFGFDIHMYRNTRPTSGATHIVDIPMTITIDIDSSKTKDMPHETHETTMTDIEIETRKDMTDLSTVTRQQDMSRARTERQVAENTKLLMRGITKPSMSCVGAQTTSQYS